MAITLRIPASMSTTEILSEMDAITASVRADMAQVSPAAVTVAPSESHWMTPEELERVHALKMEYQSRGAQIQSEARQRLQARITSRRLKTATRSNNNANEFSKKEIVL